MPISHQESMKYHLISFILSVQMPQVVICKQFIFVSHLPGTGSRPSHLSSGQVVGKLMDFQIRFSGTYQKNYISKHCNKMFQSNSPISILAWHSSMHFLMDSASVSYKQIYALWNQLVLVTLSHENLQGNIQYLFILLEECPGLLDNVVFLDFRVMWTRTVGLPAPSNSQYPPIQWQNLLPCGKRHCGPLKKSNN